MTTQAPPHRRFSAVDSALTDLERGVEVWARTSLPARRLLLSRVHALTSMYAHDWVQAAVEVKQLPEQSPLVGEEWLAGPYTMLTNLSALIDSLRALQRGRSPVEGYRFGRAPGGRTTVRVLPHGPVDRLILSGYSADVWMPPGVTAAQVQAEAGQDQRESGREVGIGAVLGAGNVTSIPVLDALHELLAADRVVLLKLNPVTDPLLGVFQAVLRPLIEHGVLRIVTGDAEVGAYLVNHPQVGHVHITGSAQTHDAIVFGPGPQGQARKQAGTPLLTKPISSELGGVSPAIVLPGPWSRADLRYQAENVVSQRLINNGYNCVATQVVVISSDWAQKHQFLAELRRVLGQAPARAAYYPGSSRRMQDVQGACPTAERAGDDRLLVGPLDASVASAELEYVLKAETFAPALAVITLPGEGREFLESAVTLANDSISGTLGAGLIAHPATLRELGEGFETELARLRYGCIGVNVWIGLGFQLPAVPWGAFPGNELTAVGSGIGTVHNALFLRAPERAVIRGPFRPAPRSLFAGELAAAPPRPPWFVTNKTAHLTGAALTAYAGKPSWDKVPQIIFSALRG
ncbi:putative aldehyde dehydrogenase [Kineosporia sp. NBRC 101677]|uniref:aldehyde dehydrogenase family protein n=1 Tax=Kineosporia sp. NBRC 101677 TaxID=3032197 RepID=UPI0024A12353|nr:aldehyde dehydrogenase family protein [Kineosporia sp. NBRC 101677]GLY14009.1 putative aldehyde dehydrogenase [Kineosporia sp. NBRC 101677]